MDSPQWALLLKLHLEISLLPILMTPFLPNLISTQIRPTPVTSLLNMVVKTCSEVTRSVRLSPAPQLSPRLIRFRSFPLLPRAHRNKDFLKVSPMHDLSTPSLPRHTLRIRCGQARMVGVRTILRMHRCGYLHSVDQAEEVRSRHQSLPQRSTTAPSSKESHRLELQVSCRSPSITETEMQHRFTSRWIHLSSIESTVLRVSILQSLALLPRIDKMVDSVSNLPFPRPCQ